MSACYKNNNEFEWGVCFGNNLKEVLKSKKIKQGDLAIELGTTDAMISRYIHGISVPSAYKVCQIANIIGCDVHDLIKMSYD